MGFKTARERKAASSQQQGTARQKTQTDSILLIWAAMAGVKAARLVAGVDTPSSPCRAWCRSLDPSQMAILRQMLENSQDRGKG